MCVVVPQPLALLYLESVCPLMQGEPGPQGPPGNPGPPCSINDTSTCVGQPVGKIEASDCSIHLYNHMYMLRPN